jgi:hypothetical protein
MMGKPLLRKTTIMNDYKAALLVVIAMFGVGLVSPPPVQTQAPADTAAMPAARFHHVHLNSVNPAAAAEYYPKAFPTTTKTTINGLTR